MAPKKEKETISAADVGTVTVDSHGEVVDNTPNMSLDDVIKNAFVSAQAGMEGATKAGGVIRAFCPQEKLAGKAFTGWFVGFDVGEVKDIQNPDRMRDMSRAIFELPMGNITVAMEVPVSHQLLQGLKTFPIGGWGSFIFGHKTSINGGTRQLRPVNVVEHDYNGPAGRLPRLLGTLLDLPCEPEWAKRFADVAVKRAALPAGGVQLSLNAGAEEEPGK